MVGFAVPRISDISKCTLASLYSFLSFFSEERVFIYIFFNVFSICVCVCVLYDKRETHTHTPDFFGNTLFILLLTSLSVGVTSHV